MIVVSDTSPVSNLIDLGYLDLLPQLFQAVVIPPKVADELGYHTDQPFQATLQAAINAGWLSVQAPTDGSLLAKVTSQNLDPGETEAIALALELEADLLLVDERAGYHAAQSYQLLTLGVLGVLLEAKKAGLIPALTPLLDRLRDDIGFWISQKVYLQVVELAGEDS